jgi:cellobiose-specific phosphotransferase system component IIA
MEYNQMADTNLPTSGQEPTAGTAAGMAGTSYRPQAGDAGNDERPGADGERRTPSDESQGKHPDMSREEALAALNAARKEAAENRRKAKELDDLKREIENAKLSETERLQKERDEAKAEIATITLHAQERVVRSEVRAVARDLGLKPELALRLIDSAAISFDDDGDPTNISELLTQAMTDYGLAPSAPVTSTAPSAQPPAQPSAPRAAQAPHAPQTGATNPPRSGQVNGAAGVFSRDEIPNLTDPRLWKRG